MATFTSFYPGGVNPNQYNPALPAFDYMPFFHEVVGLDDAVLVGTPTSTLINFDLSNGLKLKIIGTGFTFGSNGDATGGRVTSIEVCLNDGTTKMQTLSGLSIGLEAFENAADVFDPFQFAAYLMRGNDTLRGSAGDQALYGFRGNDTFIGGSGNDFVTGGEGKDNYDGNGGNFDSLVFDDAYQNSSAFRGINLDATAGTVIDPYGNAETFTQFEDFRGTQFHDIFKGRGIGETFMGLGGRDTIEGGGGSDTVVYHRDVNRGGNAGVTVNLTTGTATDGFGKVDTLVSIENARGTTFADTFTGNSAANFFRAGGGNDTINGRLGNDTLRGEAGLDVFVFNTALNATTNVDSIQDFVVVNDTIHLQDSIFTAISGTGALTGAQFKKNTSGNATDASDRIIYETDTGELFYDSNGNAAGGKIHFATLINKADITSADFFII
jgi:serralysin